MSDLRFLQEVIPQVAIDLMLSVISFQANGPLDHVSVQRFLLMERRTCPARRALLACWMCLYVCDAGACSGLL